VAGSAALILGNRINKAQAGQLRQFDQDLTGAKRELTEARLKLETERVKRLQLQRAVTHRLIGIEESDNGTKSNFDVLKPFGGVKAIFEYSPQPEPADFASNLCTIVDRAKWEKLAANWISPAAAGTIADGVTVEWYVGKSGETDLSADAAMAFADFLKTNGITGVHSAPSKVSELPPKSIRVLVGQIPDPEAPDSPSK